MRRAKTEGTTAHRQREVRSDRHRTLHFPVAVLVVVALCLVIAGFALGRVVFSAAAGRMERVDSPRVSVGDNQSGRALTSSGTPVASVGAGMVEVPDLTGMRTDEAQVVLETAGLSVAFIDVGPAVSSEESRVVQSQQPARGTVLSVDSTVSILAAPLEGGSSPVAGSRKKSDSTGMVVCIDPGHQAHTDVKLEPIGPGSKTEKPRATGGSTGVATGIPECEVALQISMNLKKRLEAAGVKVILTRTTNDVSLPNSERAAVANSAKADLFVRIHAGTSTDPSDSGISTLYPVKNKWTSAIVAPSHKAATAIEKAVCLATGARARGAQKQAGIAGFNWSSVPSVLVEVGFLTNPVEDKLMSSPKYQDEVAEGVSQGIRAYLTAGEH